MDDLIFILPEIIIFIFSLLILFLDSFQKKEEKTYLINIGISGLFLSLLSLISLFGFEKKLFYSTISIDKFSVFLKILTNFIAIIVLLSSYNYFKNIKENFAEFFSFILFANLGIFFLVSSTNLITIYLSLELLGISSYILTGLKREDRKSIEAAIKYFLFGGVCSILMLYGMSLLYGITGTLDIYQIAYRFSLIQNLLVDLRAYLLLSVILLLAGFSFKLALFPFHLWAPDTYEGAPTPTTAFLSVAPKVGGFAVLIRVFSVVFPYFKIDYLQILFYLSIVSMTLGNLVAIVQKDIKRMLAYSSIAQVGYIIIGFISNSSENFGIQSVLVYLFAYTFTNLGAFIVAIILENNTGDSSISSYAGLSQKSPYLAFAMSIFLLSLLGVPPLAGFFGKFYVFASAIKEGFLDLAIIAIINSVISAYYYLQVIRHMYLLKPEGKSEIYSTPYLNLAVNINLFVNLFFIFLTPVAEFLKNCTFLF